jgi:hypothetical protein
VGVVIAVGLLREGADWVQAARVLDLNPSGSDQDRNQRFGRLIRDHPGKRLVSYYSFFPYLIAKSEEEHRRAFSKLFSHFHARLVMENAVRPIRVPLLHPLGGRQRGDGARRGEAVDLLGRFGEQKQREIHEAVTTILVDLSSEREIEGRAICWHEASEAILEALRQQECGQVIGDENLPVLRDQIALLWRGRKSPDCDLSELIGADWDKVWAADFLEPFRLFTAGLCGLETFKELRQVLATRGLALAEAWAQEFILRYPPGRPPSQRATDPRERADAQKLSELRMAKRGTGRGVYYPSVEAILESGGHAGILEVTDHRIEAEAWARRVVARYQPGQLPSTKSSDPQERADAKKLARFRAAKAGKVGRATFYPSVESIFEAAGHRGIFGVSDVRSKAEEWASECAARYTPGRLPRYDSTDPQERRDYAKIINYRNAKRGTGRGIYHPSLEKIFEAAGHRGVFDVRR